MFDAVVGNYHDAGGNDNDGHDIMVIMMVLVMVLAFVHFC
jgi:hypothetical protein